jgi:5'-3' exoribonuclease 1
MRSLCSADDHVSAREGKLTDDERRRNSFGPSTSFSYNPAEPTEYPSSLPGFFPPLHRCTCTTEPFYLPSLDGLTLVPGLLDGVRLGAQALAGFPSLKTLPHHVTLGVHGVNVHGSESRNKSIVVHIKNPHEGKKTEDVARQFIGERVYIGWPFLQEAVVSSVSDSLFKYDKTAIVAGGPATISANPHSQKGLGFWKMRADQIGYMYSKRSGVLTGDVEVLLHVRPLKGRSRECICRLRLTLPQVLSGWTTALSSRTSRMRTRRSSTPCR